LVTQVRAALARRYRSLVAEEQRPVELILARSLIATLSTPGFLVDEEGIVVFFNDAASVLLDVRFEEVGRMGPEQWGTQFGPFDQAGERVPLEKMPLTIALRQGRPSTARYRLHSLKGVEHEIEAAAVPILTVEGTRGAMVFFWPVEEA
jgi:PAS domain-containing protein